MEDKRYNIKAIIETLKEIERKVSSLNESCAVDPIEIRDLARSALKEQPRNCDMYDTKHEAKKAWFNEEVLPRLDGKQMDHEEIPFFDWLFEKATKGETNGSK